MRVLFFALFSEAKPWIEALGATVAPQNSRFRKYTCANATIYVTGTGKLAMALAVSEFAHSLSQREKKRTKLWNLGIAGSTNDLTKLGDFFWISKLRDMATNKDYYPERWEESFYKKEATLLCFDKPVSTQANLSGFIYWDAKIWEEDQITLIDMESVGFFVAAETYFPLENISMGKFVSDHLEGNFCTPDLVDKLVSPHVEQLLKEWEIPVVKFGEDPLTEDLWNEVQTFLRPFPLSESMNQNLKKSIRFFLLNHPEKSLPYPNLNFISNHNLENLKIEKRHTKLILESWTALLHA